MKGQGLTFLFFSFLFISAFVSASVCEFSFDNEKHDFSGCDVILISGAENGSVVFLNGSIFVWKYEVRYVPKVVEVENVSVNVVQRNFTVENVSVNVVQRNRTVESVKLNEDVKVLKSEDVNMILYGIIGLGVLVIFSDRIRERLRI